MPVDDIVRGTAGCVLPLLGQNPEVVAVVGLRLYMRCPRTVTGGPSGRDERSQRTFVFVRFGGPIEPIALSGPAHEVLCVVRGAAGPQAFGCIFALGPDIGAACFYDHELVAADAPIENLIRTSLGVEAPAGGLADQRNRKRPFVFADDQDCLAVAFELELECLIIGGN